MKKKIFVFLFISVLISCNNGKNTTKVLEREDLFSLNYGNFEDELNLSKMDAGTYSVVNLCLNNGIFYLSSSVGKKVLKTSFYGDLLSIYYNPETNPKPSFCKEIEVLNNPETENIKTENAETDKNNDKLDEKSEKTIATGTRTAVEYPFNNCTFLQVNEIGHLYVVDTVPNEHIQFDSDENMALTNVILHFDEKGNFVDYIGQEGLGGTPFPNIISLSTNDSNDIIAVCKTITATKVFWFNGEGFLLSKINLNNANLPFSYESDEKFFMNIDSVFPSYENQELFLKIDYYLEHVDEATGANLGVNYDKSSIYKVPLDKNKFEFVKDIPTFTETTPDSDAPVFKKVYTLVNICKNDWAFLMAQTETAYHVLLLNLKNEKIKRFNLTIKDFDLLYSTFSVANNCTLAGLFAGEDQATISVWQIENFLN